MPSPSKRLIVCILLILAPFCVALRYLQVQPRPVKVVAPAPPARSVAPAERVETFPLDLRRPAKRRLGERGVHRYAVELKSGQVLEAAVEQNGVDVNTTLIAPGGKKLFEIDSLSRDRGAERIFLLARAPGPHFLDLRGDGQGTYTLRVLALRDATPNDRIDAQAEELFYHARIIREKQPDPAIAEFLKAEGLWRKLGNTTRRANALERAAAVQLASPGDYGWEKNIETCKKSLSLYETLGDQRAQARVLIMLGLSYRQNGDLQLAERNYVQAIKIAKKQNYIAQEWEAVLNIAMIRYVTGEYWDGLDYLDQARRLAENEGSIEHQVKSLLGWSLLMRALGKYNEAEDALNLASKRNGQDGNVRLTAQITTRFSELYDLRGDSGKALSIANQGLEERRKAKDERGEAVTLSGMSLIYQSLRNLPQARDAAEKALLIFQRRKARAEEATTHVHLGSILLDQRDIKGAMDHFSQGLVLGRRQKHRIAEIMALYGMARAEKMRLNRISALRNLEELLRTVEAMTRADVSNEDQDLFLRTRHRGYELLTDLLISSQARFTSREDLARAFEAAESADWRGLLEGLQSAPERSRLYSRGDASWLSTIWRLKDQIKKQEQELLLRESAGRSAVGVRRQLERLEEDLRTAETQLRRSDLGSIPADLALPANLTETQTMLGRDTALLRYQLGEERSFLFFITSTSAEVYTLPPQAEIEEYARQLYGFMSTLSPVNEALAIRRVNELGAILLGPVASRLGEKRLLIVPDGRLQAVPFDLFPEPSSQRLWKGGWREPLIMRHELVFLPSVSVLKAIRKKAVDRTPPEKLLAMLANPAFSAEYKALPYSGEEAKRILRLVSPALSYLAQGPEASRRLVLNGTLSRYRIIHFATHAYNYPGLPQLSSIVLSQFDGAGEAMDGELRLRDIRTLYLPADLVVLSACESALGDQPVEGEGWVGLGHGFLYAGASRVIASLWNVNDRRTPEMMEQLYRAMLVDHLPPAQALRKAQLWMMKRSPSPYYWAGFQIQGEWR